MKSALLESCTFFPIIIHPNKHKLHTWFCLAQYLLSSTGTNQLGSGQKGQSRIQPIMSHIATVWFAAACLTLMVQVSKAWEPEFCDNHPGSELVHFKIKSCQDKSAKYCEIATDDLGEYELIFRTGK